MGEWPETKRTLDRRSVWVTHGAGAGKLMAEWLVDGAPTYDVREVDIRRFAKHVYHHAYIRRRGVQQYREVYDIIHPLDQFTEPRELRDSPFHARQQDLGAVFFEGAGWERPRWYNANAPADRGPALAARRLGDAQLVADQRRRAHGDAERGLDDGPFAVHQGPRVGARRARIPAAARVV